MQSGEILFLLVLSCPLIVTVESEVSPTPSSFSSENVGHHGNWIAHFEYRQAPHHQQRRSHSDTLMSQSTIYPMISARPDEGDTRGWTPHASKETIARDASIHDDSSIPYLPVMSELTFMSGGNESLETSTDSANVGSNETEGHEEDDGDGGLFEANIPWWRKMIWSILFGAMVIVACAGNVTVIWIVLAHKRMRTVTNYLLVNLSIADAISSTLNVIPNYSYMLTSHWPFGALYCKIVQFVSMLSICASVFSLMAISFDR